MDNKIRIVLADDHKIVRNGIKQLLNGNDLMEVVGEASNGLEAIERVKETNPDILVLDVGMPELNGIETIQELKKQGVEVKILILSMYDVEEYVINAVKLGADGYILKDADGDRFLNAIKTVYQGKRYYGHEISSLIIDQLLNTSEPIHSAKNAKKKVDVDLSDRELDILAQVVEGKNNRTIGEELGVSVRTVETHRLNIMRKMNASNVADMVRIAIEGGLV